MPVTSCCGGRSKTPSPPRRRQNTLNTASNKALRILAQTPGVPPLRRAAIRRELVRRNKENYGYELAKMFGQTPPPSNKPALRNANALLRGVTDPKTVRVLRTMLDPAHAEQLRVPLNKPKNPVATMYRARRKIAFENPLRPPFMTLNRVPYVYKNGQWRFWGAIPLTEETKYVFANSRNGPMFMINRKTGRRKNVPPRYAGSIGLNELNPRNMRTQTWNAYVKRAEQSMKQSKAFLAANNYATGRTKKKPSNQTMQMYWRYHPRPSTMGTFFNVKNLRNAIKERIQGDLAENMNIPYNSNHYNNFVNLTNRSKVKNIDDLVRKMTVFRHKAWSGLSMANKHTFDVLYRRALNKNLAGIYYR